MKCDLDNFIFLFPGINLHQRVKEDVRKSGVVDGSDFDHLSDKMWTYLINSKSDNTAKAYYYSFKRWEIFITKQGFKAIPAQPIHIPGFRSYL